jgi:hypothetical protein
MKLQNRILSMAALLLITACGGGGGSSGGGGGSTTQPAAALVYTSPADPTTWRLVADAASTPTHLVLDLMAPTGAAGLGVTLILTTDNLGAQWSMVSGSSYAVQVPYPYPLVDVASTQGAALRVVVGQAAGPAFAYGSSPVLKVALDLAAGALPGSIALSASQCGHLGAAPPPVPVTVEVGSLRAE